MSGFREIAEALEVTQSMAKLLPKIARAAEQSAETGEHLYESAGMSVNVPKFNVRAVAQVPPGTAMRGGEIRMPNIYSFFGDDNSAERLSALGSLKPEWEPSKVRSVVDLGDRLPLSDALEKIRPIAGKTVYSTVDFSQNYIDGFLQDLKANPVSSDLRITSVLGTGGDLTLTLATENNIALKLSPNLMLRRPIPDAAFDAPVYEHGSIGNRTMFYAQPIGNVADVTAKHIEQVVGKIRERGYVASDIDITDNSKLVQIALFDRDTKPLLIDQGCAEPLYGTVYEGGQLVAHAGQQRNVVGIRSIIDRQNLVGKPTGVIIDAVKTGLQKGGFKPTLSSRWTYFEVKEGLRNLLSSVD